MSPVLILASVIKLVIVLGFVLQLAPILTWLERRQSAMMQDRVGPNRADVKIGDKRLTLAGLLHPLADVIKMFFKADFVPPNSDKFLHGLAPILSIFPPFVLLAVVPFTDTLCLDTIRQPGQLWVTVGRDGMCAASAVATAIGPISGQIADLNVGILYVFAMAGMGIVGATIAGWASDNKFSLMGGLRAGSQLVSYEVAMGLSVVGCMMTYGTIRFDDMARWQGDHAWGIFVQPLGFILFFAATLAEGKRAPFDQPEGESEIVAGYLVEYSGMKFGMFYTGEFIEMVTSSALVVAIFLGGWSAPFLHRDGLTIAIGDTLVYKHALPHLVVIILQALTFFGKVTLMVWFLFFIRWTLPRFRYDQLMKLGWRIMLPSALVNIFLTGVIILAVDRAGSDFGDTLQTFGDVTQLLIALGALVGFIWIVVGFVMPVERGPRARATAMLAGRRREEPTPAE